MDTDVLVCGAGPAGLSAASALSERGVRTMLIDANPTKPGKILVSWGPFVRKNGLEDCVLSTPECMEWRSWLGSHYSLWSPEAHVIDESLALRQIGGRLTIKKAALQELDMGVDGTVAKTSAGSISARIIVDAMGAESPIAKWTGRRASRFMGCHSRLLTGVRVKDSESVMIYDSYFPGDMFFWTVPVSEKSVLVGTFAWRPVDSRFSAALDRYVRKQDLFTGRAKTKWARSGNIPLDPTTSLVDGNIVFVGDSASQPLPSSGFGFHRSVDAGRAAAKHIIRAVEKEDVSALKGYERQWEGMQGFGLNTHIILSHIISGLSNEQLAAAIDSMNRIPPEVIRKFLQGTDMSLPFSYTILRYTYKNFGGRELAGIVSHAEYKKLVRTTYRDMKTYAAAKSKLMLGRALGKMKRKGKEAHGI